MAEIIINVNSDEIKKEKHICWYVEEDENNFILYEVVERYYVHPNSNGSALIPTVETVRIRKIIKAKKTRNSHLIQLQMANNTVSQIEKLAGMEAL